LQLLFFFVVAELNNLCAKLDALQQESENSGFKSKARVAGAASTLPAPSDAPEWTVKPHQTNSSSTSLPITSSSLPTGSSTSSSSLAAEDIYAGVDEDLISSSDESDEDS